MIRYYLNEEPILKNVLTLPQMENLEEREFVFADMGNMVIKEKWKWWLRNGNGKKKRKLKMLKLLQRIHEILLHSP
jgi:uncharacterized circularly permuted ATP-grasp superfamily protein